MSLPSSAVDAAAGYSPAGIVKVMMPYLVLLIIVIIVLVVVFGVKPTIGGLQV
ncbi:MAG: hypothetical protein JRN62_10060 [Nitrososphaerota archaeon]|jgi:t-SNARE complex subunit (syntaxin)|nr:hypothetical protein [Nitrososphaerota archaeon]MDG6949808.1 hypothetical protein [Nitrososphaerota archaeon]